MAAPDEPIIPMPRRVSEVSATATASGSALRHPSPTGRSQSSAFARNHISRLERSAEELSSHGGSDVGGDDLHSRSSNNLKMDELRSRSSSIQSSHQGDPSYGRRRASSSAFNLHAVNGGLSDVTSNSNSNASGGRWAHSGFVTSPTGSVRSGGSWTQPSIGRVASSTKSSSRLANMVEPLQEGRPLDSPLAPSSASMYSQEQAMSRQASQTSFSRRYDAIANQIQESLQTIPPTPSPHREHDEHLHVEVPDRPHSTDTYREAEMAFKDFDGVHFDPDREEFVKFDDEGHEVRRVSARTSSGSLMDAASLLRTPRARPMSYGAPPPSEGMVYYPAPVPKMLNLPKRLSKLPAANIQAQRRSQMLNELPQEARDAAPWIPRMSFDRDEEKSVKSIDARNRRSGSGSRPGTQEGQPQPQGFFNERMSMANAQNLPPHLRASLYFEHQPVPHDVEVKGESAVATLDSILRASVNAPVNAFTDHPYAGDVRKSVYGPEKHQRKSTQITLKSASSADKEKEKKLKKRRSSSIGNFFRRKSTDIDGEAAENKPRPASRASMMTLNEAGNKLRKRRSQMSLGGALETPEEAVGTPAEEMTPEWKRMSRMSSGGLEDQALNASPQEERAEEASRPGTALRNLTEAEQIEEDFKEQAEKEDYDLDEDEAGFVQSSTLLAELQVRKAQLKSRNRTAATAFPGGMHSTLLQLDAVEQINARKRQKQRINLAWEDPNLYAGEAAAGEEADEDVPLGVLFPSKEGLITKKLGDSRDWDRPLGLMERRELEDNEPLANRRTRLNPSAVPLMKKLPNMSRLHLAGQPDMPPEKEEEDEHEGETLGQRLQRLRTKNALDSAISDVAPQAGERPNSTFSASVLDQFPEHFNQPPEAKRESNDAKKNQQASVGAEEEETLGQRRARLQREREASGESGGAVRPPLRQSHSMANLLSSNPVGQRASSREQQAAQGTLLHTASQNQLKAKQDLLSQNMRSASYTLDRPLVDSRPAANKGNISGGLLAAQNSRPSNGAFAGGQYNTTEGNAVADPFGGRREVSSGLLGTQRSRPANGLFTGGMRNNPAAASGGMQPSPSMPMMGAAHNPYFASPTQGMMGYQQQPPQPQPMMMNGAAYYALSGGHQSMMMPQMMPHMGMGMGMGMGMPSYNPMMPGFGMNAGVGNGMGGSTYASFAQSGMGGAGAAPAPAPAPAPAAAEMAAGMDDASLNPNQRAAIDRWRMSVAQ